MNTQLLDNPECLANMKADLRDAELIQLQTYLLEPSFFAELFGEYLANKSIEIVTDARQRPLAHELLNRYGNLKIKTWSGNRTMHTKLGLFWPAGVVYCGSHNLTRGSFSMSDNVTIRSDDPEIVRLAKNRFTTSWRISKPVTMEG